MKTPDARELLATGEWEVTGCGLVRKGHPQGMFRRNGEHCACRPINDAEVERATRWLQQVAIPCKRPRATSYGLKHSAERWAGEYIGNGAMIQAALNLGLPVWPDTMERVDAINAVIPVKAPKEAL